MTAFSLSVHKVCFVWWKESTRHICGSCGCLSLANQHSQSSLMHPHYDLYPCHKAFADFGFFPCSVNSVYGKTASDMSGRSTAPLGTPSSTDEQQRCKLSIYKQIRFQANDQLLTVTKCMKHMLLWKPPIELHIAWKQVSWEGNLTIEESEFDTQQ